MRSCSALLHPSLLHPSLLPPPCVCGREPGPPVPSAAPPAACSTAVDPAGLLARGGPAAEPARCPLSPVSARTAPRGCRGDEAFWGVGKAPPRSATSPPGESGSEHPGVRGEVREPRLQAWGALPRPHCDHPRPSPRAGGAGAPPEPLEQTRLGQRPQSRPIPQPRAAAAPC